MFTRFTLVSVPLVTQLHINLPTLLNMKMKYPQIYIFYTTSQSQSKTYHIFISLD